MQEVDKDIKTVNFPDFYNIFTKIAHLSDDQLDEILDDNDFLKDPKIQISLDNFKQVSSDNNENYEPIKEIDDDDDSDSYDVKSFSKNAHRKHRAKKINWDEFLTNKQEVSFTRPEDNFEGEPTNRTEIFNRILQKEEIEEQKKNISNLKPEIKNDDKKNPSLNTPKINTDIFKNFELSNEKKEEERIRNEIKKKLYNKSNSSYNHKAKTKTTKESIYNDLLNILDQESDKPMNPIAKNIAKNKYKIIVGKNHSKYVKTPKRISLGTTNNLESPSAQIQKFSKAYKYKRAENENKKRPMISPNNSYSNQPSMFTGFWKKFKKT